MGDARSARARDRARDPVEEVALVARAKRELLLRVHRHRLRREDLEDCFSQATLEILAQVRRGSRFANRVHLAHAIEQRFLSRVIDRRRALAGRSPMQAALEAAITRRGDADGAQLQVRDLRPGPERLAMLHHDLRSVPTLALALSEEQRLVLASQLSLGIGCREFCTRFGWSPEKYRKVAQRARSRLRRLMEDDAAGVPAAGGGS